MVVGGDGPAGTFVLDTIESLLELPPAGERARPFADFILGLVGPDAETDQLPGDDRREHPRYARPIPVTVIPADDGHQAVGPAMHTIARDISAGGVSLLFNEPVTSKKLILELDSDANFSIRLVLEVLRSRKVLEGWHEVAGRFVAW